MFVTVTVIAVTGSGTGTIIVYVSEPCVDGLVQVVGGDKCPIVDTYWQTETGAHVLAPLPGVWPAKPGSATLPFFGVQPAMVNEQVIDTSYWLACMVVVTGHRVGDWVVCLPDMRT